MTRAPRSAANFITRLDPSEVLAEPVHRDRAFRRVVDELMADWLAPPQYEVHGTGRRMVVAPGNHDFVEIDPVSARHR